MMVLGFFPFYSEKDTTVLFLFSSSSLQRTADVVKHLYFYILQRTFYYFVDILNMAFWQQALAEATCMQPCASSVY